MNDATDLRVVPEEVQGASPPTRVLRRLFLTLFLRGRSARGLKKDKAPKSVGRKLAGVLFFYALFGLMALLLLGQPIFLLSAYLHSMAFIFLGMFVASSAGEVLFNREEADILLHRPIPPRTLLWAKIWVLVEVSLWLAGAFNLVGLFVGLGAPDGDWRFPLVHLLSSALMALFCTACVVMIYQLCLRWFGREWLDSVMTVAQVILSVGAVLAGQIVPQLMIHMDGLNATVSESWWPLLFPPAWFAGLDDLLAGSPDARSWVGAALGVGTTATVLWLSFGKLAGDYQAGTQTLGETPTRQRKKRGDRRWLERLADAPPLEWWLRDPVVRASFLLTAAYLARDRDVKLRVYPGLAPFLILPVVMILQGVWREGDGGGSFMVAFGFGYFALVPLMALTMLQFSQNWQASDLFRATPIAGPAQICHGARCAVIFFLTFPLLASLALTMWLLPNVASQWLLMLPAVVSLPIFALAAHIGGKGIPLSRPTEEAKAAGRGLSLMGVMFLSIALSGGAFAAQIAGWFWPFLGLEIAVVAVLYIMLKRSIDAAKWPAME